MALRRTTVGKLIGFATGASAFVFLLYLKVQGGPLGRVYQYVFSWMTVIAVIVMVMSAKIAYDAGNRVADNESPSGYRQDWEAMIDNMDLRDSKGDKITLLLWYWSLLAAICIALGCVSTRLVQVG